MNIISKDLLASYTHIAPNDLVIRRYVDRTELVREFCDNRFAVVVRVDHDMGSASIKVIQRVSETASIDILPPVPVPTERALSAVGVVER